MIFLIKYKKLLIQFIIINILNLLIVLCLIVELYNSLIPKLLANSVQVCDQNINIPTIQNRDEVYAHTPYKAGEIAKYEVRYMGALVGYGALEVRPPIKIDGGWYRNFYAEGKTGEWYKLIFVAHDKVSSIVNPINHAVLKFFIDQDEGQIFSKRFVQKKWLFFDHNNCKVTEKTEQINKPAKTAEFFIEKGVSDTLGIVYWLREQSFEKGKPLKKLVYSSGKNWWLEAIPLEVEHITVRAGKFETMKLKFKTYIGKELQQKGEAYAWIDIKTNQKPIVLIKGEIKIGSVWISLVEFKP